MILSFCFFNSFFFNLESPNISDRTERPLPPVASVVSRMKQFFLSFVLIHFLSSVFLSFFLSFFLPSFFFLLSFFLFDIIFSPEGFSFVLSYFPLEVPS